jgi:hypothetical protein
MGHKNSTDPERVPCSGFVFMAINLPTNIFGGPSLYGNSVRSEVSQPCRRHEFALFQIMKRVGVTMSGGEV